MFKFTPKNLLATLALTGAALLSNRSDAQTIFGITTSDQLVSFVPTAPEVVTPIGAITGLKAGHTVVGADFRPATGVLYIFSRDNATDSTQLYTLNTNTAVATKVGNTTKVSLGTNNVGFDFNPAVDRIRVVSSTGKNYRLSPATGGIGATDGALAYASTDANFGKPARVGSVAYTNSYIGTTTTMLFDYDDSLNVLSLQSPPNNGVLVTRGASGIKQNYTSDITSDLDIYYNPVTGTNTAYLIANTGGSSKDSLYTVNTTTGVATYVGILGDVLTGTSLKEIAVQIATPTAVTGANSFFGLQWSAIDATTKLPAANMLVTFGSTATAGNIAVSSQKQITGLKQNFHLVGMDIRPNGNKIYALASRAAGDSAILYTIDANTAVATPVNDTLIAVGLDSIYKNNVGFDFNPTVDRIRVTGTNNVNLRINPINGKLAVKDGDLNYKAGDANAGQDPSIGSCAYTNSLGSSFGGKTKLYYYDEALNLIDTTNTPNTGTMGTFVASNVTVGKDKTCDLDIYTNKTTNANTAYFIGSTGANNTDSLYTLDLTTGALTIVGKIGTNLAGVAVRDIAVKLDTAVVSAIINKVGNQNELALYPNPVSNAANVSFTLEAQSTVTINIYNALGAVVATMSSGVLPPKKHVVNINTENLQYGNYIVVLNVNGINTAALKMVK